MEQNLGRYVYTLGPQDTMGGAFVRTHNPDSSKGVSTSFFWIHANDDWGARANYKLTNPGDGSENATAQFIWAQNPTTGVPGATWMVERGVMNDGRYNTSVIPISVNAVEGVSVSDRAGRGWSAQIDLDYDKIPNSDSGSLAVALGHVHPVSGGNFGWSVGYSHGLGESNEDDFSLGAVYRNRDLTFEAQAREDFLGVSGQYKF